MSQLDGIVEEACEHDEEIKDGPSFNQAQMEAKYQTMPTESGNPNGESTKMSPEEQLKTFEQFNKDMEMHLNESQTLAAAIDDQELRDKVAAATAKAAKSQKKGKVNTDTLGSIDQTIRQGQCYADRKTEELLDAVGRNIKIMNSCVGIYHSLAFGDVHKGTKSKNADADDATAPSNSSKGKKYKKARNKSKKIKQFKNQVVDRETMTIIEKLADQKELKKGDTSTFDIRDIQNATKRVVCGREETVIRTEVPKKIGRPSPGNEIPKLRAKLLFQPSNLIATNPPPFITKAERNRYLTCQPEGDPPMSVKQAISRAKALYQQSLVHRIIAMNIYDALRVCTTNELIQGFPIFVRDLNKVEVFGRAALTDFNIRNLWVDDKMQGETKALLTQSMKAYEELANELSEVAENTARMDDSDAIVSCLGVALKVLAAFIVNRTAVMRFDPPEWRASADGSEKHNGANMPAALAKKNQIEMVWSPSDVCIARVAIQRVLKPLKNAKMAAMHYVKITSFAVAPPIPGQDVPSVGSVVQEFYFYQGNLALVDQADKKMFNHPIIQLLEGPVFKMAKDMTAAFDQMTGLAGAPA